MDIHEKVQAFFESRLTRFEDNLTIDDYENIFESGFLDSSAAMELVVFVEEEFGIQLNDDDLDLANFSTINRLVQFIKKKIIN